MSENEMLAELRARGPRPLMTREEAEAYRRVTNAFGPARHLVDSYLALLDGRDAIQNPETERAA